MRKIFLFSLILVSSLALGACSLGGQTQEQTQNQEQTDMSDNDQSFRGGQPDFSAAAEKLGISEKELQAAMSGPTQGERISMQDAADTLGVSLEELREALGKPEGEMGRRGPASGSGIMKPSPQE